MSTDGNMDTSEDGPPGCIRRWRQARAGCLFRSRRGDGAKPEPADPVPINQASDATVPRRAVRCREQPGKLTGVPIAAAAAPAEPRPKRTTTPSSKLEGMLSRRSSRSCLHSGGNTRCV